jgi:hypothetical protein
MPHACESPVSVLARRPFVPILPYNLNSEKLFYTLFVGEAPIFRAGF